MAGPLSRTETSSDGAAAELHGMLLQLRDRPDLEGFGQFYDASSSTIHGWAMATAPDQDCAEAATVGAYSHLWRQSSRYPRSSAQPWSWLRAAMVHSLHQQRHHGWPGHH